MPVILHSEEAGVRRWPSHILPWWHSKTRTSKDLGVQLSSKALACLCEARSSTDKLQKRRW